MRYVHREFSYKSPGERILKIGPHLPKLLSNIKGLGFFWNTVYNPSTPTTVNFWIQDPQTAFYRNVADVDRLWESVELKFTA